MARHSAAAPASRHLPFYDKLMNSNKVLPIEVDWRFDILERMGREKFGYAKQNEVWLRPKRTFTSDELRAILQEATDAGVAAREETTKKLLKLARRRRSRDEDSCGWVWLEIDPKLLKHIHKLDIPNVSTSYKTSTIVEDFNLYLDDVRHYQRMSATLHGMRAAAEVLKNHGINSHQKSLAD